jgi:RNA polymerase sigma-70 factor, ECF subfamily
MSSSMPSLLGFLASGSNKKICCPELPPAVYAHMAARVETGLITPGGPTPVDLRQRSDEEVFQFVKSGRQDALTVLFDRYHRLVFSVAFKIVRDPGEAEEVVQTVFLDIFRAAANFDARRGMLRVWILQYAYHRALHRRRHLVANHFYRWEELEAAIEDGSSRALASHGAEAMRLAEQMLSQLKPRQRAVLELTFFEGLTAEEIATRLGESVHAVRHDLHRSLAALRSANQRSYE